MPTSGSAVVALTQVKDWFPIKAMSVLGALDREYGLEANGAFLKRAAESLCADLSCPDVCPGPAGPLSDTIGRKIPANAAENLSSLLPQIH
jgi:hypothetical protein